MSMLDVCDIHRAFGPLKAVDGVSFQIEAGQICGFIGPNGAGKTTTMRICATLDLPDEGDVFVEGVSVLEDPRGARQKIGFMPDALFAESHTPVCDFLDFHARARGIRGQARRKAIRDVVEFTGLGPLLDKDCTSLSKGMRQRTGLAATLLHDPSVLILDEPAAGLDPRARVELRTLLSLLAQMGKAILISSHILSELSEICTVVAVIEQGTVRGSGSVDVIRRQLQPEPCYFLRGLQPAEAVERFLAEQPGVRDIRPEREGMSFSISGGEAAAAQLLVRAVSAGLEPVEFSPEAVDLEDLFLSLTKGIVQ